MAKKAVKKSISSKKLEKRWKSVDLTRFWQEVAERTQPGIEAYRVARAKSKAQATNVIFV